MNANHWREYRRQCRWGFLYLAVSVLLVLGIPSLPEVSGHWANVCYGLAAPILLLGYIKLGRAILSLPNHH